MAPGDGAAAAGRRAQQGGGVGDADAAGGGGRVGRTTAVRGRRAWPCNLTEALTPSAEYAAGTLPARAAVVVALRRARAPRCRRRAPPRCARLAGSASGSASIATLASWAAYPLLWLRGAHSRLVAELALAPSSPSELVWPERVTWIDVPPFAADDADGSGGRAEDKVGAGRGGRGAGGVPPGAASAALRSAAARWRRQRHCHRRRRGERRSPPTSPTRRRRSPSRGRRRRRRRRRRAAPPPPMASRCRRTTRCDGTSGGGRHAQAAMAAAWAGVIPGSLPSSRGCAAAAAPSPLRARIAGGGGGGGFVAADASMTANCARGDRAADARACVRARARAAALAGAIDFKKVGRWMQALSMSAAQGRPETKSTSMIRGAPRSARAASPRFDRRRWRKTSMSASRRRLPRLAALIHLAAQPQLGGGADADDPMRWSSGCRRSRRRGPRGAGQGRAEPPQLRLTWRLRRVLRNTMKERLIRDAAGLGAGPEPGIFLQISSAWGVRAPRSLAVKAVCPVLCRKLSYAASWWLAAKRAVAFHLVDFYLTLPRQSSPGRARP